MALLHPNDNDYKAWLGELKAKISRSQLKAALAVNSELIKLYWDLGVMILQKQHQSNWGDKIIPQIAADLKKAFPEIKGFSERNLKYMCQFYRFYTQDQMGQQAVAQTEILPEIPIGQQLVAQIPWGHNIQIFTKSKSLEEARFYIHQTIQNNWSRDVLALQIKSNLYARQGKKKRCF